MDASDSDTVTTSAGLPSAASATIVLEDVAVRLAVEVGVRDDVADPVDRVVVEQQSAQHRLLRLQRMRRQLQRVELRIVGHCGGRRRREGEAEGRPQEVSILAGDRRHASCTSCPRRRFAGTARSMSIGRGRLSSAMSRMNASRERPATRAFVRRSSPIVDDVRPL